MKTEKCVFNESIHQRIFSALIYKPFSSLKKFWCRQGQPKQLMPSKTTPPKKCVIWQSDATTGLVLHAAAHSAGLRSFCCGLAEARGWGGVTLRSGNQRKDLAQRCKASVSGSLRSSRTSGPAGADLHNAHKQNPTRHNG